MIVKEKSNKLKRCHVSVGVFRHFKVIVMAALEYEAVIFMLSCDNLPGKYKNVVWDKNTGIDLSTFFQKIIL